MKKTVVTLALALTLISSSTYAQEMQNSNDYESNTVQLETVEFERETKQVSATLIEQKEDATFTIDEETIVVDNKSKTVVKDYLLDKGQKIKTFYKEMEDDKPEVVALIDENEKSLVSVGTVDEKNTLGDYLYLENLDEVEIVYEDETMAEPIDIIGKRVVVFYDYVTKSIPEKTTPERIIILNEK